MKRRAAARRTIESTLRDANSGPPQTLGVRSEKSGSFQLIGHAAQIFDAAPRKLPRSRSGVDRAIDVQHRTLVESPSARFEFFQIDRNGEPAHRPLPEEIEKAFEVAQAEGQVGIDGLTRADRREIRLCDAAPHPVDLVERDAVTVIGNGIHPGETWRMTELAQRRAR